MIYIALFGAGLLIGVVVGRWWALPFAVAPGLWIGSESEVDEVPGWLLGTAYGIIAAVGIAAGVVLRRVAGARGEAAHGDTDTDR